MLALLSACGSSDEIDAKPRDGWRWETFQNVQVQVPKTFGWSNTDQAFGQWCVGKNRSGLIARPGGVSTLVACLAAPEPYQASLSQTGPIVAFTFDDVPRSATRTVVRRGALSVVVQAKQPLRSQIAESVLVVTNADWAGCAIRDQISQHPYASPKPGFDVARLRNVESVSVCRYERTTASKPGLVASALLTGADAKATIAAIRKAPVGSGPNAPNDCKAGEMGEAIVLRVHERARDERIHVRYDDCDKLGVDDGATVRRLTKAVASQIFVWPVHPDLWGGNLNNVMPN